MNWKQHIAFAIFLYAISLTTLFYFGARASMEEIIVGIVVTVFYGLLPDIDTEKSRIHSLLSALFLSAAIACIVLFTAYGKTLFLAFFVVLVGSVLAAKFLKHRGFVHTIRFGAIASLPLFLASPLLGFFALLAFLSHLVADLHLEP